MKTSTPSNFLAGLVLGALILGTGLPGYASGQAIPIPPGPEMSLPKFIGEAAKAHPLPPARAPQNPFLGPNSSNHDHNDTWMSDTYDIAGPLGREPEVLSNRMAETRRDPNSPAFHCPGTTMDSQGRLLLSCNGPGEWSLVLVDPETLEVLAYKHMPVPEDLLTAVAASYVYVDNQDRLVVPVKEKDADTGEIQATIQVMEIVGNQGDLRFQVAEEYDVTSYIPEGDKLNGVMPDWQGRIWFVVATAATVGVLDPATGSVKTLEDPLDGSIRNTFAMDYDAAYIVTTQRMYRVGLDADGAPQVVWSAPYDNIGETKPGQLSPGTGTTPTIFGKGEFVAIADNADPMQVVVYRTTAENLTAEERVVCEVPVFEGMEGGALENSLIGSGLSLIAYNNWGYNLDTVFETFKSGQSQPGIARVDIDPNGKGCHLEWENDDVTLTDAVAKMSTRTGLIYGVTRKYDTEAPGYEPPGLDVYYFSAIDFRTGKVVWERQLGTGFDYDSFSLVLIGPDGTAYSGQYGGLVAVRDTR